MDVGGPCRGDDVFASGIGLEPGDIFGNRAHQQFDALRQIADDLADLGRIVMGQHRPIEAQFTGRDWPDADQGAGQGGFARAGGAKHAEGVASRKLEGDAGQNRGPRARRAGGHLAHGQRLVGQGQMGVALFGIGDGDHLADAVIGLASADEAAPLPDNLFDRGQSAGGDNRGGDHQAAGHFALDDEIGAERQHRRLQQEAQPLGDRGEEGRAVPCPTLDGQQILRQRPPARFDIGQHAHGGDGFGIGAGVIGLALPRTLGRIGLLRGPARHGFVDDHQQRNQHAAARGEPPQHRMKHEDDAEIDRQPGQVEQRHRAATADELAQDIAIAHRIGIGRGAGDQLETNGGGEQFVANAGVDDIADANAHPRPQRFEESIKPIEGGDQDGQHHQSGQRMAGQHPVIDLQHEQRAGQHQQIGHQADNEQCHQRRR